jgi:hypothetical protein
MEPEKLSAAKILGRSNLAICCSGRPKSLVYREKFAAPFSSEFGRNRLTLRCFPTRLEANFPANCKNSLQIPAYQGIWMLRQVG